MSSPNDDGVKLLELQSVIGFDGNAPKGLRVHPDLEHIVYPLGVKIAVQNIKTKAQWFLEGHSNIVTSIAISKSGKYIASGQVNVMGFKAPVIVWSFETREEVFRHDTHKVRVEHLMFSTCENYIISLGGRDDALVVTFNIHTKEPICGTFSSNQNAGDAVTLGVMNLRPLCFITGGVSTLKVWALCPQLKSVKGFDVQMGKIKRKITCIEIDSEDKYAYCGTSTGDIMKASMNFSDNLDDPYPVKAPRLVGCYAKIPKRKPKLDELPQPDLYNIGVRQIMLMESGFMVVGAGDGTVDLIEEKTMCASGIKSPYTLSIPTHPLYKMHRTCTVGSLVTSLQRLKKDLLVGTIRCEMFLINFKTFDVQLLVTCHTSTIYDLAFPADYSGVFATASKNDVRVWNIEQPKELLRITIHNFTCSGVVFSYDGRFIVTSWNDGNIRVFTPQSGKHIFTILNAHSKGVSAVALTKDCKRIISGGGEGQVRVWHIKKDRQELLSVLKEHKGPVSSIAISSTDTQAVTTSTDGTCIIWDIVNYTRQAIIFQSTVFMCVKYHPNDCQIITCGSDRQICYWEVINATLVRAMEGSSVGALNTMDITKDGKQFITGGNDILVKVWLYDEGVPTHVAAGHAGVVTAVKISPDMSTIVSCGADGSIFIWKSPFEQTKKKSSGKPPPPVLENTQLVQADSPNAKEEFIGQISPAQSVHSVSRANDTPTSPKPEIPPIEGKCRCPKECKCKNKERRSSKTSSASSGGRITTSVQSNTKVH